MGIVEEKRIERGKAGLVLLINGSVDVINWVVVNIFPTANVFPVYLRSWYLIDIPLRAASATSGHR